jgi:Arc/MetJ family transcription regulator
MRATITLDDSMVAEALDLTHARSKKELIEVALQELIDRRKRKRLLALEGKAPWDGDLDAMRQTRG